jgi:hypothetical protein
MANYELLRNRLKAGLDNYPNLDADQKRRYAAALYVQCNPVDPMPEYRTMIEDTLVAVITKRHKNNDAYGFKSIDLLKQIVLRENINRDFEVELYKMSTIDFANEFRNAMQSGKQSALAEKLSAVRHPGTRIKIARAIEHVKNEVRNEIDGQMERDQAEADRMNAIDHAIEVRRRERRPQRRKENRTVEPIKPAPREVRYKEQETESVRIEPKHERVLADLEDFEEILEGIEEVLEIENEPIDIPEPIVIEFEEEDEPEPLNAEDIVALSDDDNLEPVQDDEPESERELSRRELFNRLHDK